MCGEICGDRPSGGAGNVRNEASVALQVLPWLPMEKVYPIVDRVIGLIRDTGVRYEVGPFETTMEGELDVLLDIVKKAQHLAVEMGAPEVLSMVKISYRPDAAGTASIASKTDPYRKKGGV